ncbi:hypothetical protein DFI02_1306 [Rhizobium sp. PP-F2F-G20b]|nr:hypothetical protein DFI02_1306 [Rhizobium sp. PP-F2F-G20b]
MLSYSLLKNHAGILLVGDYTSLTWLHEVVHDVNDRSPLVIDKEGSFLAWRTMCAKRLSGSVRLFSRQSILKKLALDTVSRSFGQSFCCSKGC